MNSESTTTVEIHEFLAISGEYLGMGTDAVAACRDRSIEPFGNFNNADPLLQSGFDYGQGLSRRSSDVANRHAENVGR